MQGAWIFFFHLFLYCKVVVSLACQVYHCNCHLNLLTLYRAIITCGYKDNVGIYLSSDRFRHWYTPVCFLIQIAHFSYRFYAKHSDRQAWSGSTVVSALVSGARVIKALRRHKASLNTVEPCYLELDYFELPLISKWKSGPCFNMTLWQQVTK